MDEMVVLIIMLWVDFGLAVSIIGLYKEKFGKCQSRALECVREVFENGIFKVFVLFVLISLTLFLNIL